MDPANLQLTRPSLSPYQGITSGVTSLVTSSPQDSRRTINGWSDYPNNTATVVSHGTCNYPPYATTLGAGGVQGTHKPAYNPFPTGSELINNCNPMQINQYPLSSHRSFPPFYSEMYQANHTGMSSGIFTDLSIPPIPRFEPDGPPPMVCNDNSQNPGKCRQPLLTIHVFLSIYIYIV